ncbi:cytochrome b [Chitinibacter tainanensis]|uniref:cytochrome b n=1 Tax=Chitinibacter tainanensis TaxID=230667 RepID=UPI002356FFA5|nr:cytochrome b [Chitinibacter tainanensis]
MKKPAPAQYSALQIGLHWLVAALILAAFILIWQFGNTPLAPDTFKLKLQLIAWHKWVGITVLALFVVRLIVKLVRGAPEIDPATDPLQRKIAIGVHHLLYLLMAAIPLLGWMLSSAKGYPVLLFGVVQLPDLVGKNEELGHTLREIHELLANGLLVLIGLHAAGAIKHHVIEKDGTLARMLPFLRRK